jgi:hypothetical protein
MITWVNVEHGIGFVRWWKYKLTAGFNYKKQN